MELRPLMDDSPLTELRPLMDDSPLMELRPLMDDSPLMELRPLIGREPQVVAPRLDVAGLLSATDQADDGSERDTDLDGPFPQLSHLDIPP